MRKMTEKQLTKWESRRNPAEEILQGIRDIQAGRPTLNPYLRINPRSVEWLW